MKRFINRLVARLGYVPAPAKLAPSTITMELNFQIDSAPLDNAIAKLDQLSAAASRAEAAVTDALLAHEGEFIGAELVADESQALILTALQKQTTLLEVLAKQGDHAALRTAPTTGAAASGPPG
ncbi:hypothetical protein GTP55_25485 [Duganella sp. FT109W]|uniref:Uncharacterized protein n=1 Tax=Duganella margarita TaxID=2692170 RepID=A0ABW9WNK5_9BURK|nr:hypothetical protein [Duganella margarita]MYN42701.1 hypothetical protein [Duganella margarita]